MPAAAGAMQPRDHLIPLLERKRMIDGAWVVCMIVVLIAVAVPWFLRILEVDLARVAAAVFAYVVLHLVFAALSDRLTSTVAVAASLRAMVVASVVFLAFFWHLVGGLKHPMFLAVFTLPVIMSGILMIGWQAHITAAVSVLVVLAVAMIESSDLRWYAGRLNAAWIANLAAAAAPFMPRVAAFPGVETSPAYEFTLLETFTAIQLTVAFISRPLAVLLVRVNSRLEVSGKLLTEVQGLFHAVLRAGPDPGVILYADTYQLVQASDSFFKRMLVRPSEIVGKGIFEVIKFEDPDAVRAGLSAQDGELPFCVYKVHGETRIANLYFYRTEHQGVRYLYVGWKELTELYYLQTAFDAVEDPLIVVTGDLKLQYANTNARSVFGSMHFGMDLKTVASLARLLEEIERSYEGQAECGRYVLDEKPYEVRRLVPRMPGEAADCFILWLHCIAKEEALFEQAVRDPLTGAYNRRYFDDALSRHLARSKGRLLACAYFDFDDFKRINDQWGHAAGDAALVSFADSVRGQLRATDLLARLGGDEFAVLFVNCDTEVAASAIERMRATLDSRGWTYDGITRRMSFSAGLAASHLDDDPEQLLHRTDRAVYAAKAAGKGRTVVQE